MIHPHSEIVSVGLEIGLGVRATRPIPRGTIVWALDRLDSVLSPAEFEGLATSQRQAMQHYGYRDRTGRWILCWDGGRLVNHACNAAMRGVGPDTMIAVRDLDAGEELTCDYAECNVDPPLECRCGDPACRGRIAGIDLLTYDEPWTAEVAQAVAEAGNVEQPLWPVLLDPEGIRAIVERRRALPSLRTLYLTPGSAS